VERPEHRNRALLLGGEIQDGSHDLLDLGAPSAGQIFGHGRAIAPRFLEERSDEGGRVDSDLPVPDGDSHVRGFARGRLRQVEEGAGVEEIAIRASADRRERIHAGVEDELPPEDGPGVAARLGAQARALEERGRIFRPADLGRVPRGEYGASGERRLEGSGRIDVGAQRRGSGDQGAAREHALQDLEIAPAVLERGHADRGGEGRELVRRGGRVERLHAEVDEGRIGERLRAVDQLDAPSLAMDGLPSLGGANRHPDPMPRLRELRAEERAERAAPDDSDRFGQCPLRRAIDSAVSRPVPS
jgi:hypothetical protein